MSRIAALVFIAIGVVWAQRMAGASLEPSAGTALVLGFVLVGAWLAGSVLRRWRVPQLTAYVAFGALLGPYLGQVLSAGMADQLAFLNGIATTLIAFIAGLTLNVERLGSRLRPLITTTAVTLGIALTGLVAVGWLAWPWLPIAPQLHGATRLAVVTVLAAVVLSVSPTMTAAVLADLGRRSAVGELVLAMVVMADLVLVLLFATSAQLARAALAADALGATPLLARVVWEIGGALAVGSLVGALFALYLRYVAREVPLVLLGVCVLLSQLGATLQVEALMAAVAAGFIIENLAVRQGDSLRAAVEGEASPLIVVFFVAVGTSLRFDAVAAIGLAAVGLAAVRAGLLYVAVRVGVRASGLDTHWPRAMWTGLISQAGLTVGFAATLASQFPEWGPQAQLLVVAVLGLNELVGPMAFRHALARAAQDETAARPLVVVSNREPYQHDRSASGEIVVRSSTGGVAVALDALMRERGGVWIAHGAGPADRLVVDAADTVQVPPDSPAYALRRLWIERPVFDAYYGGFANEGLWPLCHVVDVRPTFRAEDWHAYVDVNGRFARAAHEVLGADDAPVFIQDYHLALVAPALRRLRPHARAALFWHIPWPSTDRLRICPWRRELVTGLLANDLLAFQLDRDRRNFLMAAEEELGADVDDETSRVRHGHLTSTVVSVPIGVDYDRIQRMAVDPMLHVETDRLRARFELSAPIVGLGVDRLDYTKGIPERLAALDLLLSHRPELRGRLTFLQIGVPSRSSLERYAAVEQEIARMASALNAKHAVPGGAPLVVLSTEALGAFSLTALYRLARFCVVSSLHDGMNLVAKEFVAARDDDQGVLVLSALAGAAQELGDAVLINPYDIDEFASALGTALDMSESEQRRRMRAMRKVVAGRNVFGWASDILEGLESVWTKPLLYSVRGWDTTSA